jgi:predicted esterase
MTRFASRFIARYCWILMLAGTAAAAAADEPAAPASPDAPALPKDIVLRDYLVLPAVGQYGRLPLHRDALEAQLVSGTFGIPTEGDAIESHDGRPEAWRSAKADAAGRLDTQNLLGGYALATFDSPTARVMLLEAAGHAMVYVNGRPRAGDVYSLGWLRLPVLVRQGQNTLLFHLADDQLSARLTAPPTPAFIANEDRTLPTLVRGETGLRWAAVPIVNATDEWLDDVQLEIRLADTEAIATPVAPIAPLSVRKTPFQLRVPGGATADSAELEIRLIQAGGNESAEADSPLDVSKMKLKVAGPNDIHLRTFRSRIDRSIQKYAVRPTTKNAADKRPGVILTLHAAGVSCEDHVAHYAAKEWAHLVAPQGRRPHGFDWEAWGREDALEALADAGQHYPNDSRRTYLSGHSMGGHGAWHVGVTYPGRFAAVAPSSAWISFWSYGGGMPSSETPTAIDALLLRGYSASDTLKLLSNLTNTGVYVLHGASDQNVPAAQARFMRSRLASFHTNFAYYEQADADHWWGNACCDWAPMMEFLQHQISPAAADSSFIDFTTANPAVSSQCHWVSIEAQREQLNPSQAAIRQNVDARTFVANTNNVARLAIDVAHLSADQPIDVTLDGQAVHWLPWPEETPKLWFERQGEEWSAAEAPSPQLKGPARYGTFNAAFDNDALLVYGTNGSDEENDWAASKACYDAETFYYRGGGALEVLPDVRFDINADTDRNIILYGNADTNRAWTKLLSTSPVEVRRGQVRVGTRTESGDDLAVMMVRPRPGSDVAMVGLVGGTGPAGMRLTNRLRWFVSGIVFPDLMVIGPRVLIEGTADVRAWGYFGLDWQVDSGEISWRNPVL